MELAGIVRAAAPAYTREHRVSGSQRRALSAIAKCRTPALGATTSQCDRCGQTLVRYHSCCNRHCPKCQTLAKERWLAARSAQLLPVPYFHVVFTLPHALNPLARGYPRTLYSMLFSCAAETLQTFARDPRWLGGELAITMVLHTWNQKLEQHLHVHCLVSAGGLTPQGQWRPSKPGFLFPVQALSRVFRGKFLTALRQAQRRGALDRGERADTALQAQTFAQLLHELREKDWVVYAKRPFAGPEQVLAYLARYTHRVAISNERLLGFDEDTVRFRWRDRRRSNRPRVLSLSREEFLRRFLLHVLPSGFMRLRHFGLFANRTRSRKLALAYAALQQPPPDPPERESAAALMQRVTGIDIERCPHCQCGRLRIVAVDRAAWQQTPPATGPPP